MPSGATDRIVTDVSELFGTRYPIIQGGMIWASGWRLAAAVSKAGGLGLVGAGSMSGEVLALHVSSLKSAWSGPFGVNIPVNKPEAQELIDICIAEQVPVVFTSSGSPRLFTKRLKEAGILVAHVVPSAELALKVQAAGCDAVVAEGTEAGGHNGFQEITSLVLWPSVVDAVDLPVIAAGGIADGRGMAAALAMGAGGVQVGTRFATTVESSAHVHYKNAIVQAKEGQARLYMRSLMPTRAISNKYVEEVIDAERVGASVEQLLALKGRDRTRTGIFEGNRQEGDMEAGQSASRIMQITGAAQVVEDMVDGFRSAAGALAG